MKEKNICVFGDSITWGANDTEYGGWFNRLWLYNANREGEYNTYIYNLGIPGDTTNELLTRIDNECKSRIPTTVIIAIGINDTACKNNIYSTQLDKFISNINNIIKIASKYTSDIIFVGLTRVNEKLINSLKNNIEFKYYNDIIFKYDSEIRKITEDKKLKYIYLFDKIGDADISIDGIHPNNIGHKKIFNELKQVLYDC